VLLHLGLVITLCLIQGMGLLDFPGFGFVVIMTMVDLRLKLTFSGIY